MVITNRSENLTDSQEVKLAELLQYNLCSIRSCLLKEELEMLWDYKSAHWAGKIMDQWYTKTMRQCCVTIVSYYLIGSMQKASYPAVL
jgi:hypothetical protein